MHINFELFIAAFCVVFGIGLQWRANRAGAKDMALLGVMIWIAGAILLMDCHWHFLTEPEH